MTLNIGESRPSGAPRAARRSRVYAAVPIGAISALTFSLLAAPGAVAAPSPSSWRAVPGGINPASVRGASAFGTTPASTPETVAFVLDEQNVSQLEAGVEAGTVKGMSVSDFARTYGQSQANISQLTSYLASFKIATDVYADGVDVVANGTAGEFDKALNVSQKQFHAPGQEGAGGRTSIPAQTFHGATGPVELPSQIASYVAAILGLTNYSPFTSDAVHTTSTPSTASGNSTACATLTPGDTFDCNVPANFAANYGLNGLYSRGARGQGQTIGIVTLAALDPGPSGFTWAPQYYWQNVLGLAPSGRTLTVDNVDGGPGAPSFSAGSSETDLDVEQSGGLAPDANVIVYQAPNTDFGFADAFFTAASQDLAGSVSASWGLSETALQSSIVTGEESPGYAAAFDEAFLELAAQSQATFVSAGDGGAYTAAEDIGTTNLSADNPADSPYVTAAGGTTLPWNGTLSVSGCTTTTPESVAQQRAWGWDYLWPGIAADCGVSELQAAEADPVGGGGGFSSIEPQPSYQRGVSGTSTFSAVPYLTPTDFQEVGGLELPTAWTLNPTPPVIQGTGSGRALPDVSADADPFTGYLLYSPSFVTGDEGPVLEGGWGGTSFVAPQLNGATAIIDSALGGRVGFWNPAIYQFATHGNSPFSPLSTSGTQNDNLYYTGTPGTVFNEASGLGTPNLSALASDFAGAGR